MKRLPEETLEEIGAEVRRRRWAAQMSMEELARIAELSRNYVNKVELGKADLSVSALVSIADALACDVVDLLPGPEARSSPEFTAAARLLSEIDPEVRAAMIAMMRKLRRSGRKGG